MLESFTGNVFEYKKLTPEEQQQRGILGRLMGVIADTVNPTRNGRKYSAELWDKVFQDPIMQEKIANKCVFGEIAHPLDGREEVDPEKIAICLSEVPKKNGKGQLIGIFDVLNTPCGKLLKTMLDYGTTVGVSSRGSGDTFTDYDGQESVDPETYECTGWDVVFVPAVKEARMQYVTESLQSKNKKSLTESLNDLVDNAPEEEKAVMEETLKNIKEGLKGRVLEVVYNDKDGEQQVTYFKCDKDYTIDGEQIRTAIMSSDDDIKEIVKINESLNESKYTINDLLTAYEDAEQHLESLSEDVPHLDSLNEDIVEEDPEIGVEQTSEDNEQSIDSPEENSSEEDILDAESDSEPEDDEVVREDNPFDYPNHIKWAVEKNFHGAGDYKIDYHRRVKDVHCSTKKDLADSIVDVFGDGIWDPTVVDMEKQKPDESLVIRNCINNSEQINESIDSNTSFEVGNAESDVDIIEDLQEALQRNYELETKVVELQEKLSVCYAKEAKNTEVSGKLVKSAEELSKKNAKIEGLQSRLENLTTKLTEERKNVEERDAEIKKLQESSNSMQESKGKLNEAYNSQLAQKDSKIKDLSGKVKNLGEEVKSLNESITQMNETAENERTQLTEKLEKSNTLVEKYKRIANKAVDRYIESKALMLGATMNEVKNRLPENYTFNDIDKACEDLQTYKLGMTKLPFRASAQPLVESAKVEVRTPGRESILPADGFQGVDDVDDNLLALAGLI